MQERKKKKKKKNFVARITYAARFVGQFLVG